MTATHDIELATSPLRRSQRLLASLPQVALGALLIALLAGAWLSFFVFVPFDFTPPRPR